MRADLAGLGDDWPRTTRVLPWLLAVFLCLIWLVPVHAIAVGGLGSKFDVAIVAVIALVWVAVLAVAGSEPWRARVRRRVRSADGPGRASAIALAGLALLFVAGLSVLVRAGALAGLGELGLAGTKLLLLLAYLGLLTIVATTVRPREAGRFGALIVVLGCLAAIGTMVDYRTGTNVFYEWTGRIVEVGAPPEDPEFGRENITGATGHAVAIATMLALALAFAVAGLLHAQTTRRRVLAAVAIAILLGGAMATVRKTGALAPAAVLVAMLAYRPRAMLRMAPYGLAIGAAVLIMAPGAAQRVKAQFLDGLTTSPSSQGRIDDYEALASDMRANLALGRGYGSYDARQYRFVDNQYLKQVVETGVVGLLAYLALLAAVIATAHRAARSPDPVRGPPALGVVAGAIAFAVASALFDVLAFPQPTELFCFVAGLALACRIARERRAPADAQDRVLDRRLSPPPVAAGR